MSEEIQLNDRTAKPSVKKSLNRLSRRTRRTRRTRRIIRYLIIVLCVWAFIINTALLFIQYSKRQTVVNIKIETIKYNRIPAITICYPAMVSMERTVQKYPELRPLFDEYKNKMKDISENDYKNKTVVEKLNNLYRQKFTSFAIEKSNVKDFYDLSIPFSINCGGINDQDHERISPIDITVKGMRLYSNESVEKFEITDETRSMEDYSPAPTLSDKLQGL